MNMKIYIIVVLALIITTLSQTVSIISGDHGLYQTVQDKCIKCHGDIKIQLSASAQHSSFSCTSCHTKSATNHTNTKPECRDCHNVNLNNKLEAHTGFIPLGSEGCVACHTTYNVIVNYSRPEYIDYNITRMQNGDWLISNFSTNGVLNVSNNAGRNGGNHNWKNVSCKDCHQDIFNAVSSGGHAVVLKKDGTQVSRHSNANTPIESWCRTCHGTNDAGQHAARNITCDECHQAYGAQEHPGDFINTGIKSVPHLYRSLVCIACKSVGWQEPGPTIHFRVHEEPYFDVVVTK